MANNPVNQTPPPSNPGPDYSVLKSQLSRSKMQQNNPAAYQTISQLIDGVKKFQDFANSTFTDINGSQTSLANDLNSQLNAIISTLGTQDSSITSLTTLVTALAAQVIALTFQAIYTIELDTSGSTQSFDLTSYTLGFFVIKDIAGNASVNNITIIGIVDGVTNPVINTNYGIYRLYKSVNNNFYTW